MHAANWIAIVAAGAAVLGALVAILQSVSARKTAKKSLTESGRQSLAQEEMRDELIKMIDAMRPPTIWLTVETRDHGLVLRNRGTAAAIVTVEPPGVWTDLPKEQFELGPEASLPFVLLANWTQTMPTELRILVDGEGVPRSVYVPPTSPLA